MRAVFLMLALSLYAFGYNQITHEYGYYKDSKSGKVFRMYCDVDSGYFMEWQAIKKGGVYVPNQNVEPRGYNSGSCSFVAEKLKQLVNQGKLKRIQ